MANPQQESFLGNILLYKDKLPNTTLLLKAMFLKFVKPRLLLAMAETKCADVF